MRSTPRRLLERFAFIAFGLYHIPLFLNNYPSLGGGGFNENGLAVRWGHVFTPAGIWVARHVFGMTGPMPMGITGDNGDVGEEWGRLLLSVVIGIVGAVGWTIADRRKPRGEWVEEAFRVMLRYSIALGLASYAIAKILPIQFPRLDAIALEDRLGDMTPMNLLWRFMMFSRPYNFFGGLMELVAVFLLCYRRTATLGALVCLAVMTNVAAMNYAYGVQVKLYATMIVLSAVVLILYDMPRLLAVFVKDQGVGPSSEPAVLRDRFTVPVRWTVKSLLVGSVLLSSLVAMVPSARARTVERTEPDGRWVVTLFARQGPAADTAGTAMRWRRLIVDGPGLAIRLETDSLLRCQRVTAPGEPSRLQFTCPRDRLGDLHWTRVGDTLGVEGTFDKAQITATAHLVEPRLMRSKFRWIYDKP